MIADNLCNTDGIPNVVLSKRKKKEQENVHMIIRGDSVQRLAKLKEKVHPHTKTEVFVNALRVFDALINEYEDGAVFFIQRQGEDITKYDIFEDAE